MINTTNLLLQTILSVFAEWLSVEPIQYLFGLLIIGFIIRYIIYFFSIYK